MQERIDRLRRRRQEGVTLTPSEQADLNLAERTAARPLDQPVPQVQRGREEAFAVGGRPVTREVFEERRAPPEPESAGPAAVFISPLGRASRSQRQLELQAEERFTQTPEFQRIQEQIREQEEVADRAFDAIQRLRPLEGPRDPVQALINLAAEADADPEEFQRILYEMRRVVIQGDQQATNQRQEDATTILRAVYGLSDEEAAEFFAPNFGSLVSVIFPDSTPEENALQIEGNPEAFLGRLNQVGRTPETQALLRFLGLSWSEISEVLDEKKVGIEINGVTQFVEILDNNMVLNPLGQEIGRVDQITQSFIPYEYLLGDVWKSFTAGVGDVIATSGAAARWMGADGIGENLTAAGRELQVQGPADTLGEFSWQHLANPRFWSDRVVRTTAFTLALVPAAIVGSWFGAGAAVAFGFGTFGTRVLQILGAAAMSRSMESPLWRYAPSHET